MDNNLKVYTDFKERLKLLISKNKPLIAMTLSNIFSMRLVGNKTHGDLAEIGIMEFINQFMYDFRSIHVGKDKFRAKEHEEDIEVINEITQEKFSLSLKAYGDGPLQLSTDRSHEIYPFLKLKGKDIKQKKDINEIFKSEEFQSFKIMRTIPLIYNEQEKKCNIMVFNYKKLRKNTSRIIFIDEKQKFDFISQKIINHTARKHPIFMFIDFKGHYICEVRYGGTSANALQRGFWTHTKNARDYFDSLTGGWLDYSHNETLVKLFSLALNSSKEGHKLANKVLQKDIDRLKEEWQ